MDTKLAPGPMAGLQDPGQRPRLHRDPLAFNEPLSAPTPTLHAAVIENIDGYNDDTKGYAAAAHEAFTTAHAAIQSVIDASKAVADAPWTPEMKLLSVAKLAETKQAAAAKAFDSAVSRLKSGIESIEKELTQPVEQQAGHVISTEMREYCKKLGDGKREAFIRDALEHGDTKTLTAICGAAHYLSGLTRERHALLIREYHALVNPKRAAQLSVMKASLDHCYSKGPLLHAQIEHAMGWRWPKVHAARQRENKAQEALKIA